MNAVAGQFVRHVLGWQALTILVTASIIVALVPSVLLIDPRVGANVLIASLPVVAVALATTVFVSWLRLRHHRFTLRALALGSSAIEVDDLAALARLPAAMTQRLLVTTSLFAALLVVPALRPNMLDTGRAISLFVLTLTLLGAASIPHYVLVRSATSSLFELAPPETTHAVLEVARHGSRARLSLARRLVFAVVVPTVLVGAAAVLVIHAHLRSFVEEGQRKTAVGIARGILDAAPGELDPYPGRQAARQAARDFGFEARLSSTPTSASIEVRRQEDGTLLAAVPLDLGQADIAYTAQLDPWTLLSGAALALVFALAAAGLGATLGRALARDFARAIDRVRLLGTDSVMAGVRGPEVARFQVIRELEAAIERLAERFRVFAEAQERALEARENAQRMKGLLFASVSHDLKSPLNAVLGFADLVDRAELSPDQRESLDLISTRGRELLALIETILDAARVEAGQLDLEPTPCFVSDILSQAIRKARDLIGSPDGEVVAEADPAIPPFPMDAAYVVRALAVVVAHGLREGANDPSRGVIRMRAAVGENKREVRIAIQLHTRAISTSELREILAHQASHRGRGLTLGLSLARAVFQLHGGSIQVEGASDDPPTVLVRLPFDPPKPEVAKRQRLSSYPAF